MGVVSKFGNNNLPGNDWARSLLKRHSVIGQRIATNISRARAEVSPTTIAEYFENLENVVDTIPPENIFNYDESNLQDDLGKKNILININFKWV